MICIPILNKVTQSNPFLITLKLGNCKEIQPYMGHLRNAMATMPTTSDPLPNLLINSHFKNPLM